MLALEFDGCPQIRERRRRSEAAGLVFAGFETTAAALAWTIALLCRNPIALGKAYAEVDALGGKTLAYDDLENLKYLRACFDEAQRFQAAPANVRTAIEDDEVGGYFIPRGSQVIITQYALQRDPGSGTNRRFNPDRFLTDKINRNTFLPFSIGPRKCMGTRMAYIEEPWSWEPSCSATHSRSATVGRPGIESGYPPGSPAVYRHGCSPDDVRPRNTYPFTKGTR